MGDVFADESVSIWAFSPDGHYALTVSPRLNTITSRDQFKPIRLFENLVLEVKIWLTHFERIFQAVCFMLDCCSIS